jgi:hypothetical protein
MDSQQRVGDRRIHYYIVVVSFEKRAQVIVLSDTYYIVCQKRTTPNPPLGRRALARNNPYYRIRTHVTYNLQYEFRCDVVCET